MVFFVILFLILIFYSIANYYVGMKVFKCFKHIFPKFNIIAFIAVFSLLPLSSILSFFVKNNIIAIIGSIWMGTLLFLVLFLGITDIALYVIKQRVPNSLFISSFSAILLAISLSGYGLYNASQIKTASYSVEIDKSTSISQLKIALVTDIHLGYINDETHLAKIVQAVNTTNPDIICISGDIFDGDFSKLKNPEGVKDEFKKLTSKYGTYAVVGNHDAGDTYDDMISFLTDSNITLLFDEYIEIENEFIIAGRRDSSPIGAHGNDRSEIDYTDADMNLPIIVMDHQPSNIISYEHDTDLVLSGHTHQGQMFPISVITDLYHIVDYGYYVNETGTQIVVTSGAGTWGPPMRIGTFSEIAEITVTFK